MNSLILNQETFGKFSKRLKKQFSSENVSKDISLSLLHEQLAKSLGFRNYNGLTDFLNKTDSFIKDEAVKTQSFLNSLSEEQILSVFSCFIKFNADIWTGRANTLLSCLIPALIYIKQEKEIYTINADFIKEYMIFDNIIKLYKTRRDLPSEIRNGLRSYLYSLPGFQESAPKQSETTIDQHGYLQMQFSKCLNDIKKIENSNIIIYPKEITNFILNQSDLIDENHYFFKKWLSAKNSDFFNKHIQLLIKHNANKIINKNLYLTDIILLSLRYLNQEQRKSIYFSVEYFMANVDLTKEYSDELVQLVKSKNFLRNP